LYAPKTECDAAAWGMQPKNSATGLWDLPTPCSMILGLKHNVYEFLRLIENKGDF